MSGCQEFAERNIQSIDGLMSSESALRNYNDGYMWSYFVQTHRLCNTALLIKVNPKKKQ